ncbi:MAG: PatB family C-S lyase [Thiotrichales bacterium]|nr:PatB family C-S lyase [Thiotrichales bacterium]
MEKTLGCESFAALGFDLALDRENSDAEKYALRQTLFGTDQLLPMWVADMDLPTPPFIIEALKQRLDHPILGYPHTPDALYQSIIDWQSQYGLNVQADEIVFTHNVANGFMMAVGAFTQPGDAVLIMPPVYPPFFAAVQRHHCRLVEAPLQWHLNRYYLDFAALEDKIRRFHVKLLLFCHPQNPSGRVWLKEELEQLADLCVRYQVILISDEIHADLTFPPKQHLPLAALNHPIVEQCITLNSPGKTFNLGGLQIGYALIRHPQLRQKYRDYCHANALYDLNLFAQVALQAAYTEQGKQWRSRLLAHFDSNIQELIGFFAKHLPAVNVVRPEASYLVWLDFRQIFSDQTQLKKWCVEQAKLGLNDGETFGGESRAGTGFMRMNLAVSKATLHQALQQLTYAIQTLKEKK